MKLNPGDTWAAKGRFFGSLVLKATNSIWFKPKAFKLVYKKDESGGTYEGTKINILDILNEVLT